MPIDLAHPSAAGIALHAVPGFPALFGKRMREPAPKAATEAEALSEDLLSAGGIVVLLIPPSGCPSVAFQFSMLPPTPQASRLAAVIRSRFFAEAQFRKDLFGWLLVEGGVYQRYGEHQPRPVLEAL